MDDTVKRIKENVIGKVAMDRDIEDSELYRKIDEAIMVENNNSPIPVIKREKYRMMVFNSMKRLDILQELLDDPSITEIMINGFRNIFVEREGKIYKWEKEFPNREKLEDIAQKIAGRSNRIVNESKPIVDTRLNDGSRVNIVLAPAAIDGPVITIRKFYKQPVTIEKLIALKSITREASIFLENAVKAKYNIFISGGTGSGKTTFLNALSEYIPKDERIITIEDSAELQIAGLKNIVRLEARNANVEGSNAITIRELIKSSLRMRPDRIIVGEVRGEETMDMLNAMNTGHDGSLSTGHANSPKDMLSRLETMVLMGVDMPVVAIRSQIASAIDIIIHLGRIRDKSRRVLQIVEVKKYEEGMTELNILYEFKEYGEDEEHKIVGELVKKNELCNLGKMYSAGIMGGAGHI